MSKGHYEVGIGPPYLIEKSPTETISTSVFQVSPPEDPTAEQRMKLIESSGVLNFWNRPEEDVYTENDGEPI